MKNVVTNIVNEIRLSKDLPALDEIKEDDNLRNDLGFTSFDLAELTVRIEDEFDIDVFEDGLVNTVGEIFAKLGI